MKTIIKNIILSAALMFTFSACDFLVVPPHSTMDPDFFLTTEESAELTLAGVYNILGAGDVNGSGNASTFRRDLRYLLNGGTDECAPAKLSNTGSLPYTTYSYQSSNSELRYIWLFFYAGINRANTLLEALDDILFANEDRKTQMIAEARFLRGVYYQYLTWIYGGVPITLNTEDPAKMARQSLEEVYKVIEDDLIFAYNTLNETSYKPGRANKWSAAGYLSKMYLYLASCKENNVGGDLSQELNSFDFVGQADMYKKAYDVNSAIIGKKSLHPTYHYLFRAEKNSQTYDEVLFGVEASNNINFVMMYIEAYIPQGNINTVGGGYGHFRPGFDLYKKYDRYSDVRFANNITGNLGGNPAVLQSEVLEGVTYYIPNALADPLPATNGFISVGKWRYPKPGSVAIQPWASNCNFQLVRYADILLMQAELEYKYKNDEAKAREYLNQVRERAAKYDAGDLAFLNATYKKADIMDEIMDERTRELCFECWRRLDLIRTGRLESTLENISLEGHKYQMNMAVVKANYESFKIWFPIPDNEMAVNDLLIQNDGYSAAK